MKAPDLPDDPATDRSETAVGAIVVRARTLVAERRMAEAQAAYRVAAQAGDGQAQVELARMLLYGVGSDPAPREAVEWLVRAERGGNPLAGYYLALVAVGGHTLPRDAAIDRRAHEAVQARHPPSLRAAAIHFGRKPHSEDQALCLQLLEAAAAAGDALAAALLAERLIRGEGTATDAGAGHDLYEQLGKTGVPRLPAVTADPPQQPPGPARSLDLRDVLVAPRADLRAQKPRVGVIDGLLSADECRLLVASATPGLRASRTVDPDTGLPIALPLRTSSDANLDPIQEDLALRLVQMRIAAAAGFELIHAEPLTVLRYEPGQQYRPHRDYVPPGAIERDHPQAGNRARTICVYLNDVEEGGETEFPVAGVRVTPKAGRAVVFDNLHANGQADPDSLHAGLPVKRGEKWLATLWLRQRPYRDY